MVNDEYKKMTNLVDKILELDRSQIGIVLRDVIYCLSYNLKMENKNFEQQEFLSRMARASINLFIQTLNGREFNEDYLAQYYSQYKK